MSNNENILITKPGETTKLYLGLPKEEAQELYLQKIEEKTNTLFDRSRLPGGIQIALAKLMNLDPERLMVSSQKLNDMSQTYISPKEAYGLIQNDLEPYTRPHLAGNKRKRVYLDGR